MQRNIARAGALAGGLTILTAAVPAAAQSPIATAIAAAATARPATPQALSLGGRKLEAKLGKSLIVKGHGPAGRTARLQLDSERGWQTIGTAKIHADGTFRVQAKPAAPTRAKTRVVAAGQKQMAGRAKVYRFAFVSWYGPGLYGGHLACGGTLTAGTLGVANKYLPCGSKVSIRHNGHRVTVPVVDRGPYVAGREYDLTAATAQKLGFSGTGNVLVTR